MRVENVSQEEFDRMVDMLKALMSRLNVLEEEKESLVRKQENDISERDRKIEYLEEELNLGKEKHAETRKLLENSRIVQALHVEKMMEYERCLTAEKESRGKLMVEYSSYQKNMKKTIADYQAEVQDLRMWGDRIMSRYLASRKQSRKILFDISCAVCDALNAVGEVLQCVCPDLATVILTANKQQDLRETGVRVKHFEELLDSAVTVSDWDELNRWRENEREVLGEEKDVHDAFNTLTQEFDSGNAEEKALPLHLFIQDCLMTYTPSSVEDNQKMRRSILDRTHHGIEWLKEKWKNQIRESIMAAGREPLSTQLVNQVIHLTAAESALALSVLLPLNEIRYVVRLQKAYT